MLELDTPRRILDLACGFERHANRLAALGHTVTSVDRESGFLVLAREHAAEIGFPDEESLQVLHSVTRFAFTGKVCYIAGEHSAARPLWNSPERHYCQEVR